jgi:hypothetical protein
MASGVKFDLPAAKRRQVAAVFTTEDSDEGSDEGSGGAEDEPRVGGSTSMGTTALHRENETAALKLQQQGLY